MAARSLISLAAAHRKLGDHEDERTQCERAQQILARGSQSERIRGSFEAVCGSPDAALELLRIALEKRKVTADWARLDPNFEFIRDDPKYKERFEALLDEFSAGGEEKGPE